MTEDEFIALTTEAGFEEGWVEVCNVRAELTRLIELAAAKEREACLKIAYDCADADMHASMAANAIDARNK